MLAFSKWRRHNFQLILDTAFVSKIELRRSHFNHFLHHFGCRRDESHNRAQTNLQREQNSNQKSGRQKDVSANAPEGRRKNKTRNKTDVTSRFSALSNLKQIGLGNSHVHKSEQRNRNKEHSRKPRQSPIDFLRKKNRKSHKRKCNGHRFHSHPKHRLQPGHPEFSNKSQLLIKGQPR